MVSPSQLPLICSFLENLRIDSAVTQSATAPSSQPSSGRLYVNGRVVVLVQREPNGFGDAVLQAEQFVAGESFAVVLGDHLFQTNAPITCLSQLLGAHKRLAESAPRMHPIAVSGVGWCSEGEVPHNGLIQTADTKCRLGLKEPGPASEQSAICVFQVSAMAEKPSLEFARTHFASRAWLPTGSSSARQPFVGQFGIDVLPAAIFDCLRTVQKSPACQSGVELGLRDAMKLLQERGQLYAALIDGHRFDLGIPSGYWQTLQAFARAAHCPVEPARGASRDLLARVQPTLKSVGAQLALHSPIYSASAPARLDVMGGL